MSGLQAVTLSDMKKHTSEDATLIKLLSQIQNGTWSSDQQLRAYSGIKGELSVFEGVILRGNRIVVPQSLRKQTLKLAHETHQGIVKTKQFLRARFFWPGVRADFGPPADLDPPGPYPLADLDPPSRIWPPHKTFLFSNLF